MQQCIYRFNSTPWLLKCIELNITSQSYIHSNITRQIIINHYNTILNYFQNELYVYLY